MLKNVFLLSGLLGSQTLLFGEPIRYINRYTNRPKKSNFIVITEITKHLIYDQVIAWISSEAINVTLRYDLLLM